MKALVIFILLFCLLLLTIALGVQNDQLIDFNYLIAQTSLRLSSLMAVMLLLGVLLSGLVFSLFWLRLRWQISQLKRLQKNRQSEQA